MKLNEQAAAHSENLFLQIPIYLDLLLRWNARTNLTAIRSPEEIITRHFGESLFAAQHILPAGNTLADVGSGAGFPGIPIKLSSLPSDTLHVTLIEAHQKKATFLREVIRALHLTEIEVQPIRAEHISRTFDVVTLRAVEHFDQVLPAAARLLNPGGRIALLIGEAQFLAAQTTLPSIKWDQPRPIPNSQHRVLAIGTSPKEPN